MEVYQEDPSFVPVLDAKFFYHYADGHFEKAIQTAEEFVAASPNEPFPQLLLALGHAAAGHRSEAHRIINVARRTFGEERLANRPLGRIHATLGEIDEAFRAYERGFDNREWTMTWLRVSPYVYENSPLRQDPRYWDLMRRMNFPPFPRDHPGYAEEQAQQARRP
jgi:tetratricopeptide (TPR) repeat protein